MHSNDIIKQLKLKIMKTVITQEELNKKIAEHKLWLIDKGENRLSLSNADLRNANLRYADLRYADLRNASLYNSNLGYSNLRHADLSYSNLRNANLRNSNLGDSNLSNADLRHADLHNSDLRNASLYNSDLRNANLGDANLRYADLRDAYLDPKEQYRLGVMLTEPLQGWKKCKDGVIVELEIPAGAVVFSINGNKCRTNKAIVLEIEGAGRAYSGYTYMTYYKGDTLTINDFNLNYSVECGTGIHFFKNKEEAINYSN